jgi:hypothetical protein
LNERSDIAAAAETRQRRRQQQKELNAESEERDRECRIFTNGTLSSPTLTTRMLFVADAMSEAGFVLGFS